MMVLLNLFLPRHDVRRTGSRSGRSAFKGDAGLFPLASAYFACFLFHRHHRVARPLVASGAGTLGTPGDTSLTGRTRLAHLVSDRPFPCPDEIADGTKGGAILFRVDLGPAG